MKTEAVRALDESAVHSCVTPVAADASTFSAVRSDVSYAAPDSGYTWTETDTPEITGTSHSHKWASGSVLPPSVGAG